MRFLIAALSFALSAACLSAGDLRIVRVWPDYRTTQSFVSISEYFTGQEKPVRNQTILRSQPGERAGFYFLTRLANQGSSITGAKIQLDVISSRAPEAVSYTFPINIPHGQHVYQVGLTGTDWPVANEHPVAWRVLILDTAGNELLSKQSFLWSKPDGH
ncbi:MAG TPA: hypothetical protein VIM69_04430 [Opitutaceae bacterium]